MLSARHVAKVLARNISLSTPASAAVVKILLFVIFLILMLYFVTAKAPTFDSWQVSGFQGNRIYPYPQSSY